MRSVILIAPADQWHCVTENLCLSVQQAGQRAELNPSPSGCLSGAAEAFPSDLQEQEMWDSGCWSELDVKSSDSNTSESWRESPARGWHLRADLCPQGSQGPPAPGASPGSQQALLPWSSQPSSGRSINHISGGQFPPATLHFFQGFELDLIFPLNALTWRSSLLN